MHLVHISNRKLNQEVFSNRAHSIHRRIVIKNFLTMLYQLHPIEWIEPSPVDDQDQWLEQTLSAAGIDAQVNQGPSATVAVGRKDSTIGSLHSLIGQRPESPAANGRHALQFLWMRANEP